MAKKPGDTFGFQFTSQSATGALTDADSTPTGKVVRNGTDDNAPAVTIARISTGLYRATGTIPGGYSSGDDVQVRINATVSSVASSGLRDYGTLDGKRVSDLNDAVALADYQQRAVAVTLPTAPTDWLTAAAVKTDAVTKIQAGLSTYSGGAVASVTAPVTLPANPPAGFLTTASYASGAVVGINLAQTGFSPRTLDSVADSALTVGDALVAAMGGAVGKASAVGTAYTVKTPSTGTVIRTFTLDSASAPTTRN